MDRIVDALARAVQEHPDPGFRDGYVTALWDLREILGVNPDQETRHDKDSILVGPQR